MSSPHLYGLATHAIGIADSGTTAHRPGRQFTGAADADAGGTCRGYQAPRSSPEILFSKGIGSCSMKAAQKV